ncbi:major capsid protein [Comamonas testosteroni]|uniref:major capsid protein n=1 Tax=Comamonas testosteroni TaxID=285 RepID=UPI0028E3C43C|nr:major capsid protein [Comamonas testosteroni]
MGRLSNLRVVDPVLTNLAIGYTNATLVAETLMPFVYTDKEGSKIPKFGKEAFKLYRTERALRASSNRMNPEDIGSVDVVLDEHDLEYPIDYREAAESAFPLQRLAVNTVTEAIRLRHEAMVASMVQNPNSYGAGNKLILSGTSQFTHKDSDPEGVVDDAKDAISAKIAKDPNTMVIGKAAWRALKRHPQLKAILSDTRSRLVQLADLREIFEIENIVVGRAIQADDRGATSNIWGDNIVLAYVPQNKAEQRSEFEPSFGYTLRKRGQPVVDTRAPDGKVELVRNTDIFRPYLLGAEAGYLIGDTNA